MSWRSEDYGYATAAAAAVAFLGYLVAGNFGLVPSPLTPPSLAAGPNAGVAALEVPVAENANAPVPVPGVAPAATPPSVAPPPSITIPLDQTPPSIVITSESGASLALGEPAYVSGTVIDAGSKIDKVLVTFTRPNGEKTTTPAEVICNEKGECAWMAEVPGVVADYTVYAEAIDAYGNVGRSAPIDITVLNTGGTVQDVIGIVERVPATLNNIIQQLLGLLS
ncbi:MAG: hypothetical protein WD646_00405 [Actinomycetota bacterium]